MKKNYYAKVLALTVAASMVSVPAFAEEGDGTAVAASVKNADTSLALEEEGKGTEVVNTEKPAQETKNNQDKIDSYDANEAEGTQEGTNLQETGELNLADGSIQITESGYSVNGGEEKTYTGDYTISYDGAEATTNTITVVSGEHNITLKNVNIDVSNGAKDDEIPCAFAITGGKVTLTLEGENTLHSGGVFAASTSEGIGYAGLWVKKGAELVIQGEGQLTATGGCGIENNKKTNGGAGIGGSNIGESAEGAMGNITINSGTIIASGAPMSGRTGAGIGWATGDNGSKSVITINGGKITATGYGQAAGIGATYGAGSTMNQIIIKGGDITATAKGNGAGIGCGEIANFGLVQINDGTVTATVESGNGAGIGGANGSNWSSGNGCEVEINGGTVTATGCGYGAGIGGGGTTVAAGEKYAGGRSGNIRICGDAVVTATGGQYGVGIGSGGSKNALTNFPNTTDGQLDEIVITSANVTANNGENFAGTPFKVMNENGNVANTVTGIGQGANPSEKSAKAFETWAPVMEDGDAIIYLKQVSGASYTYTRNGSEVTVTGNGDSMNLWLPEGYYQFGDSEEKVLIAKDTDKVAAEALKTKLNAVDTNTVTVDVVITLEEEYNKLSSTLKYYVDQTVDADKTIEKIKEAVGNKEENAGSAVTFELKGGEFAGDEDKSVSLKYNQAYTLPVPQKDNYRFLGWYQGDVPLTNAQGKSLTPWKSLASVTATAKWESTLEGSGIVSDPYILNSEANILALARISYGVGTADDFGFFGKTDTSKAQIEDILSRSYKLGKEVTLKTADGFYGIGSYGVYDASGKSKTAYPFTGTFDGDNKVITLEIDTSNKIFREEEANKESSNKEGTIFVGKDTYITCTAGLINSGKDCTIQNVHTIGNVKLSTKSATCGVILGNTPWSGTSVTVENCVNNANISVGATFNVSTVGGIVGAVNTTNFTIENCINNGKISAGAFETAQGNSNIGGIFYSANSKNVTVKNCVNNGDIYGTRQTELSGRYCYAGGIFNALSSAAADGSAVIENCENHGNIHMAAKSGNYAGGIFTSVNAGMGSVQVKNCKNYGEIIADGGLAGAIFGGRTAQGVLTANVSLEECYHVLEATDANSEWKVSDESASVAGSTLEIPVTTEAENYFTSGRYVVDANSAKVADIYSADGSKLYKDLTHNSNVVVAEYPFQSWADAYTVKTAEDYTNLVKALNGDATAQNAVLGDKLSESGVTEKAAALAKAYVKIDGDFTISDLAAIGLGKEAVPFAGKIDGQNHTITYNIENQNVAKADPCYVGLIGYSAGAEAKNINFAGKISVAANAENGNNMYVAPAIANGSGAVVSKCNSTVEINVVNNSEIKNATGGYAYAGGMIGYQNGCTVEDSTYTGNITSKGIKYVYAGGIGADLSGMVKRCTVNGNMSANLVYNAEIPVFGEDAYAGGIAGKMSGTVENCTAVGKITSKSNFNGSGRYAYAGGIAGGGSTTLTVKNSKAFTTVSAENTAKADAVKVNAVTGTTLVTEGDVWAVKTASVNGNEAGVKYIDTTVLSEDSVGSEKTVYAGQLPTGITLQGDTVSLDSANGKVKYVKAGAKEVAFAYDGTEFFKMDTLTVTQKDLTNEELTFTNVNSAYKSEEAAQEAKDDIQITYNGTLLQKDVDYTIESGNGKFTITFIGNYCGQQELSYVINANISVKAEGYDGSYDGKPHKIQLIDVPNDAKITYGTEQSNITSSSELTYTDAGTYTVYWKVVSGNGEVTGSAVVKITKAKPELSFAQTAMTVRPSAAPFKNELTKVAGTEDVKYSSSNEAVATVAADGTITVVGTGTTRITASVTENKNFVAGTTEFDLTVKKKSSSSSSDTSAPIYGVSTGKTENGKISVTPAKAEAGEKVTIKATPDSGYQLDKVTVKDKDNSNVKLTKVNDDEYTFTMPKGKVSVDATFVQKDAADDNSAAEKSKVIKLQIGSRIVNVDNEAVIYDTAPVIRNDRTLVPIRIVTETLGGKVDWNGVTKEVTLHIDGKEIKMTVGKTLEKYGVAPVIIDGRTFVPVRFVADELGATVAWDDATKTVTITKIEK